MVQYKYIIVGGGMTADAAVKGIRSIDTSGSIAIFTMENDKPYNRPPLSKALWKGGDINDVWRNTAEENLTFYLGTTVTAIDRAKRTVTTTAGTFSYEKLLLATGGAVRTLPFQVSGIIYYRTLADYRVLRALADSKNSFLVIGGGFIGTEVAAALTLTGKQVTMIFPEGSIGERNYPKDLSNFITEYYSSKGVIVHANESITDISRSGDDYIVTTKGGKIMRFDGIIAGIGILPNTSLASEAGLSVDNGIVVDEFCRTSDQSIYAAGDVANFFNPHQDKRIRIEHEDNANSMGEMAGKNMAGANEKYNYLPAFYSDLFDLGYEAVGELDARHEIVSDWKDKFREGVIYYFENRRIKGVLLWNVWGQVEAARNLIGSHTQYADAEVKGLIQQ
ncbi:MAG TPA: FAD-dependent oxidoreductase [Candidatus Kapabacteria bacterium]|nr:FAD-dependent oxidoreductase [Candidatus Kapabacteria bacterium]